jgi:hypothetical protein
VAEENEHNNPKIVHGRQVVACQKTPLTRYQRPNFKAPIYSPSCSTSTTASSNGKQAAAMAVLNQVMKSPSTGSKMLKNK